MLWCNLRGLYGLLEGLRIGAFITRALVFYSITTLRNPEALRNNVGNDLGF